MLEIISIVVSLSTVSLGILSGLLVKDYYKKFLEVEKNPWEWNLLSYGVMTAFVFHILFMLIRTDTIVLNASIENTLFLIAPLGSFLILLGSIKLWREFRLG